MYYTMSYASPLGAMTLAANETALVGLWFDGQKYDMEGLNGAEVTEKETPVLKKLFNGSMSILPAACPLS